jgi:hypothetical protein
MHYYMRNLLIVFIFSPRPLLDCVDMPNMGKMEKIGKITLRIEFEMGL